MKKRYIVGIFVGILAILLVAFAISYNSTSQKKKVELNYWNNPYARYVVCEADMDEEAVVSYSECRAGFSSKSSKKDIIASNKDAYIGEVTYIDDCLKYTASLFFYDDNYYVLYYDDYNNIYRVQNCYINYGMSNSIVYVPSPVSLYLEEDSIQMDIDYGDNTLDYLFDNYSFEEAKIFYERLSQEYVEIDTENQKITVDGYDVKQGKQVDKCLTLDFKEKTVIGKNEEGNTIIITGKK